jgi:hypothetical protein
VSETQYNYTSEQTQQLLSLYSEMGTERIEEIAELMKKPVRSVRSKLVKEGVYIPAKRQDKKKNGPSKKELLNDLDWLWVLQILLKKLILGCLLHLFKKQ